MRSFTCVSLCLTFFLVLSCANNKWENWIILMVFDTPTKEGISTRYY